MCQAYLLTVLTVKHLYTDRIGNNDKFDMTIVTNVNTLCQSDTLLVNYT